MTNPQHSHAQPSPLNPQPCDQAPSAPPQTAPATSPPASLHTLFAAEAPGANALVPLTPLPNGPLAPSAETNPILQFPLQPASFQALHAHSGKPRNGKVARLPQLLRELVNRMLFNHLPHQTISAALDAHGYYVTERNISNWKTRGGYKEWCAAQEHALELRLFQDNLTQCLRRENASEVPEVGLQSVATSLSALFLRRDLMPELLADPDKYKKLVELQCSLARSIQALQKDRDNVNRALGCQHPERLRREEQRRIEDHREHLSTEPGGQLMQHNWIRQELPPTPAPELPPGTGFKLARQFMAALAGNSDPQPASPSSPSAPAAPSTAAPPPPTSQPSV